MRVEYSGTCVPSAGTCGAQDPCSVTELFDTETSECYCAEGMEAVSDSSCECTGSNEYAAWDSALGKHVICTTCVEVRSLLMPQGVLSSWFLASTSC